MNNKGQEVNPVGVVMGLVGGAFAFWMAGTMGSGIVTRVITGLLTVVACYFLASAIMNK